MEDCIQEQSETKSQCLIETESKEAAAPTPKSTSKENWMKVLKLAGLFAVVIVLSIVLVNLLEWFMNTMGIPLDKYAWVAYLVVFGVTLVAHLALIAPVPVAVPIMIVVASYFDPFVTALVAALGGTLGELSTYFIGYAGRRLTNAQQMVGMQQVEKWIHRWGAWAIVFLAFQPIIPLDIGGLAAGAARMPLKKFLPALFVGKLPKYLLMIYLGEAFFSFLPDWLNPLKG